MPRGIPLTLDERAAARKRKNLRRAAKHREAMKDPTFRANFQAYWRGWYAGKGKANVIASVKRYRANNPKRALFNTISTSARVRGLEYDIAFEGLSFPTHCPALGIELDYKVGKGRPMDNSPSFDRVDNDRGYVKGNVIVVSQLANRIKTSATPEQLRRVADFYGALGAV